MTELLHADLTHRVRGLAYTIHNELCGGHDEATYEAALAQAMEEAGVPFQEQPVYRIQYRDQQVGEYRPDFVTGDGKLLLELKATPFIEPLHKAQAISYLAVTQAELALIMNFGGTSMQFERIPNLLGRQRKTEMQQPYPAPDGLLYPALGSQLLNALIHVHFTLGPGFLHQVYRRSARIELAHRGLGHEYIEELPLRFNGRTIKMTPTRLLLVEDRILVATVAMQSISARETERLRWAMKATNTNLGLIANFYGTTMTPQFVRL